MPQRILFQARRVLAIGLLAGSLTLMTTQSINLLAAAPKKAPVKTVAKTAVKPAAVNYQTVNPVDLLKTPQTYLNQNIIFEGTFNRFTDTGLDYKKAFRDARDYVGMMIYRPDVKQHKIPLSELKMFFPRKKSEEVQDLETGDVIQVKGSIFNTALGEPWMEVTDVKVLQKTKDSKKKPGEECC